LFKKFFKDLFVSHGTFMTHFAASLDGQERGGKLLSNEGNP